MKIALHSCRLGYSHLASDAGLGICPGLEEKMIAVEGAGVECSGEVGRC